MLETVGIEGQAPRICFANFPDFMSLVLRQGEPHEMDYGFDPPFTKSKEKRVADATLFSLKINPNFNTNAPPFESRGCKLGLGGQFILDQPF